MIGVNCDCSIARLRRFCKASRRQEKTCPPSPRPGIPRVKLWHDINVRGDRLSAKSANRGGALSPRRQIIWHRLERLIVARDCLFMILEAEKRVTKRQPSRHVARVVGEHVLRLSARLLMPAKFGTLLSRDWHKCQREIVAHNGSRKSSNSLA
jgi:hypothetical protein